MCRVCHSKFRDPKSVLNHLKHFHPEHARKAWNKFQVGQPLYFASVDVEPATGAAPH